MQKGRAERKEERRKTKPESSRKGRCEKQQTLDQQMRRTVLC